MFGQCLNRLPSLEAATDLGAAAQRPPAATCCAGPGRRCSEEGPYTWAQRPSNAPIMRCTTCSTSKPAARGTEASSRATPPACGRGKSAAPHACEHCRASATLATRCGLARRYRQVPPNTATHLLEKDGGHLAVQRRLEGKVHLESEPGGVRGGPQPAQTWWRCAAMGGEQVEGAQQTGRSRRGAAACGQAGSHCDGGGGAACLGPGTVLWCLSCTPELPLVGEVGEEGGVVDTRVHRGGAVQRDLGCVPAGVGVPVHAR